MSMPNTETTNPLGRVFRFLASLKLAIPLIVLLTVLTIIGSLFPQPDWFSTWWYLGLLGLLGLSLLLITVLHIPRIVRRTGRNAMIGVVATHAGILVLIAGAIYGGISGERYTFRAIEQEMTVVPGLPFVIRLEELAVEEYPAETWSHVRPDMVPKKRQDSRITLHRGGRRLLEVVVSPGRPAEAEGYRILPSVLDFGRVFELVATDELGNQATIPVRPWAPPLITVGGREMMAHALMEGSAWSAQVFTLQDERMVPLGTVAGDKDLVLDGHSIALGAVRYYTGLSVYNRPHAPVLIAGCILMLAGLVWHFYFRHKERA